DVSPLELPTDYPRPAVQGTRGGRLSFDLGKEEKAALLRMGKERGATLFMTLLSVFKVLLYRYSGQADICVGTPVANREEVALEGLQGFFLNNVAVRTKLDGGWSFEELLGEVKGSCLSSFSHQMVPFEQVVERVVAERDRSRSPIFQVVFVLHNEPASAKIEVDNLSFEVTDHNVISAKYDLLFS
ncbi:MAG: condensation domain-containing protein, partial [Bacteroidota bacterium]